MFSWNILDKNSIKLHRGKAELLASDDIQEEFISSILQKVDALKMPQYVSLTQNQKRQSNYYVMR